MTSVMALLAAGAVGGIGFAGTIFPIGSSYLDT
jgi:hypothetical protein